jgi:proteasome assembly chaperone (PAC2) family protein
MWLDVDAKAMGRLRRPWLLVAVSTSIPQYSGLYSQARELASYMLAHMKFKDVATFYSSSFAPEVIVSDAATARLPACRLSLHRGSRDLLLFSGDSSPMEDQDEFAKELLARAKKLGVKDVCSVGARWTENPATSFADQQVNGFATSAGAAKLQKLGVQLIRGEAAPFFSSVVVGLGPEFGMEGYKVSVDHGEPRPHSATVGRMLGVVSRLMGFEIDLKGLSPKATEHSRAPSPGIYH